MTKAVLIAFILCAVFIEEGNFQTENPSERLNRFSDDSGYQPGGPSGGQGRGASGTITDGYPDSNSPPVRRYPSRNYAETSSVKSGPPGRDYNVRPSPDQNQRSRASQQRSQDIRGQQQQRINNNQSPNPYSNDPGFIFRQQSGAGGQSFPYEPYPRQQEDPIATTTRAPRPRTTTTKRGRAQTTKRVDPFSDPDRYRVPQIQQAKDNVRFVNGRPYREPSNIQVWPL